MKELSYFISHHDKPTKERAIPLDVFEDGGDNEYE